MKTNQSAIIVPPREAEPELGDIRGLRGPVAIPNPWVWVAWILALAAAAALAWMFWKRRRKLASQPKPEVLIPAHVRARERLREALALIRQPVPFCVAVSAAVRAYLEERFKLHAPDRTTEEFLEELQGSALLTCEQKRSLGGFLSQCDLVKFARYEPGETELRQLHDAAVQLVVETEPPPMAPPAPSGPPGQPAAASA